MILVWKPIWFWKRKFLDRQIQDDWGHRWEKTWSICSNYRTLPAVLFFSSLFQHHSTELLDKNEQKQTNSQLNNEFDVRCCVFPVSGELQMLHQTSSRSTTSGGRFARITGGKLNQEQEKREREREIIIKKGENKLIMKLEWRPWWY